MTSLSSGRTASRKFLFCFLMEDPINSTHILNCSVVFLKKSLNLSGLLTKSRNKCPKLPISGVLQLIVCTHIRCLRLRLRFLNYSNTAFFAVASTSMLMEGCLGTKWCADDSLCWNYADSKLIDSNDSPWIESNWIAWCKRSLRKTIFYYKK